jgi:hypothetical protein
VTPEEHAKELGVPLIPRRNDQWKQPYDPNPVMAVCGGCGLQLNKVMHYVCSNPNCPTGLGGTVCRV